MWDLDEKSSVLNALPTNKTYGIINSLLAPLSVGGRVVMMDKFDPIKVSWSFNIRIYYNDRNIKRKGVVLKQRQISIWFFSRHGRIYLV